MLKRLSTMFRPLESLLIISLLVAASYTYNIKHQVDLVDKNISKLYKKMDAEKDKIDLLEADWALLNQVARLETLVERYNEQLQLQPLDAKQIISLNQLPPKKTHHTPALDDIDSAGSSIAVDQLTTGAVDANAPAASQANPVKTTPVKTAPVKTASQNKVIKKIIADEIITTDKVSDDVVNDIAADLFNDASNGIVESDFSNENGSN